MIENGLTLGPKHPAPFDPVSVNPDMSGVDDLQQEILALMRKAKIRAELIYAYLRTGLLVTEENYEHLPPKDRRDWDRAIVEYRRRNNRRS
jgi:hypothetical protein